MFVYVLFRVADSKFIVINDLYSNTVSQLLTFSTHDITRLITSLLTYYKLECDVVYAYIYCITEKSKYIMSKYRIY